MTRPIPAPAVSFGSKFPLRYEFNCIVADRKVPLCSSGCRREILLKLILVPSSPCIRDAVLSSWIIGRPVTIVIEWGLLSSIFSIFKHTNVNITGLKQQVGHLMHPSFPIDLIPDKRPSNLFRVKKLWYDYG